MKSELIYHQKGIDPLYKIWHILGDNIMIIYTYSNDGNIVFSDKIYPIKKGVFCFIGSKKYHYTMPENPQIYDRTKVYVNNDDFFKILSLTSEETHFFETFSSDSVVYAQIPPDMQPSVEQLLDELNEYSSSDTHFNFMFTATVIKLLIFLDTYSLERIPQVHGFTAKTIKYINEHITEDISIETICQEIHVSKYYLCHKFKKLTGITIMDYILKTRLTNAKYMLKEDEISVSEIAEKCGFCSISYFCRVFKEHYNVTPLAYRKEHRK